MARCDQMADTYTMTGSGIFNGVIETQSLYRAQFYIYENDGQNWHFTLGRTNRGRARQTEMRNMHFTIDLDVGQGIASGHIFFDSSGSITGYNDNELSTAALDAFRRYRNDHATDIQAVISCMASQLV